MSVLLRRRPSGPTVTRLRAKRVPDTYGERVRLDWDDPDRLPLPYARVQFASSHEAVTPGRQVLTTQVRLFAPGTPDVTAGDRIAVGEDVWEVEGAPNVRHSLAGRTFTRAVLRRVEG